MVIDTSALVAIFLGEPERKQFQELILQPGKRLVSAASVLETGIVLESKRGEAAGREFDLFVVRVNIEIVPVDAEQVEVARSAWRRYGKGRHAAGLLGFGDNLQADGGFAGGFRSEHFHHAAPRNSTHAQGGVK